MMRSLKRGALRVQNFQSGRRRTNAGSSRGRARTDTQWSRLRRQEPPFLSSASDCCRIRRFSRSAVGVTAFCGDEETRLALTRKGENEAYSSPSVGCPGTGSREKAAIGLVRPSFLRPGTAAVDPELPFDAGQNAAPVASDWSVGRVGLSPTGKRRLLTAHTPSRHLHAR
jgi:hypothetical protein